MAKLKILFVCTGNTCRSPMAEGGLKALLDGRGIDNVEVMSVGTAAVPGCPATQYAMEAVKTWHGDLSGHRSRPISSDLLEQADMIFAMTPSHYHEIMTINPDVREKTYLLKRYPETGDDGEGIADPIGGSLDQYNQTFLEIGEELGRMLPDIIERAREKAAEGND